MSGAAVPGGAGQKKGVFERLPGLEGPPKMFEGGKWAHTGARTEELLPADPLGSQRTSGQPLESLMRPGGPAAPPLRSLESQESFQRGNRLKEISEICFARDLQPFSVLTLGLELHIGMSL